MQLPRDDQGPEGRATETSFFQGLWADFKLYLRAILLGFAKTAALLLTFFLVRKLTVFLGLTDSGWEGEIISSLHSIEAVIALTIFGIFFLLDVVEIRKHSHGGK